MTTATPNTPTPDTPQHNQTSPGDSIQPWLIFGFVLAVLVVIVAAVAVGINNDQLTAITVATVAIVGAGVTAFKVRR
ncbi:MAG: hypothetical protein ACRBK7_22660 [Acidimicrobiales bacterium]